MQNQLLFKIIFRGFAGPCCCKGSACVSTSCGFQPAFQKRRQKRKIVEGFQFDNRQAGTIPIALCERLGEVDQQHFRIGGAVQLHDANRFRRQIKIANFNGVHISLARQHHIVRLLFQAFGIDGGSGLQFV